MGGLMSTPILIAAGAAIAAWLLVMGLVGGKASEQQRRERLLARVRGVDEQPVQKGEKKGLKFFLRRRPNLALRRPQRGPAARLATMLRRAGIDLQPSEFALMLSVFTLLGATGGSVVYGRPGVMGGALLGFLLPLLWVRQKTSARRKRINGQLNELLQTVAGALGAGQSFLQALSLTSREIGDPIAGEIRVMLSEVELGATLDQAFERLRERVRDDDLDLVIDAVLIQRRVGGNLAEVLTNISFTIRERIRIRGEVKTLTSQARMSGWLLSLLPVGVGAAMYFMNREYIELLWLTETGRMLMGAGIVGQVIGTLFLQKIANVKV